MHMCKIIQTYCSNCSEVVRSDGILQQRLLILGDCVPQQKSFIEILFSHMRGSAPHSGSHGSFPLHERTEE